MATVRVAGGIDQNGQRGPMPGGEGTVVLGDDPQCRVGLAKPGRVGDKGGIVDGGEEDPHRLADAVEVDDLAHAHPLFAAQSVSAVGVGLTAGLPRPPGWISQCRWGGVVAALPVRPT